MTRMTGMVRMTMFGITVIFTNGLDGQQLFTLFTDSGFSAAVRRLKTHLDLFLTCLSIT